MFLRVGELRLTFPCSLLIPTHSDDFAGMGPTSWRWVKWGLSSYHEWNYYFNLIMQVVFNGLDVVKVILSVISPESLWSVQLVLRTLIVSFLILILSY